MLHFVVTHRDQNLKLEGYFYRKLTANAQFSLKQKVDFRQQTTFLKTQKSWLGGGFNPIEKYARQIGSFPQVEVKIKNVWVATT